MASIEDAYLDALHTRNLSTVLDIVQQPDATPRNLGEMFTETVRASRRGPRHFNVRAADVLYLSGANVQPQGLPRIPAGNGDFRMVKYLASLPEISRKAFGDAREAAIENGHRKIAAYLEPFDPVMNILNAIGNHQYDVAAQLVIDNDDLGGSDAGLAFSNRGYEGTRDELAEALREFDGWDSSDHRVAERALLQAIKEDDVDAVSFLLPFVDAEFDLERYMASAVTRHSPRALTYLLSQEDERDVAAASLLSNAVITNDTSMIPVIGAVPGVDLTADDNKLFRFAVEQGNMDAVRVLLASPSVTRTIDDERAIDLATASGHFAIAKLIRQSEQ